VDDDSKKKVKVSRRKKALKDLEGRLRKVLKRLDHIEKKLDEVERQQRLMLMESNQGINLDQDLMMGKIRLDLLNLAEELDPNKLKPDDLVEDESLIDHVSKRLNESKRSQSNIYHLLLRILLKQEIQNSRSKLLFLNQNTKELDLSLFDELKEMEEFVSNPMINLEELSLRWKIFEDRVKRELERIQDIEMSRGR
jgi:hypothetical protein